MKKANQNLSSIFCVAKEMKKNLGEDSFYYGADGNDFIVAAFDGCGGSGSKKYENFSRMTGAFIGSHAVCGGVKAWFENSREEGSMATYIGKALEVCTGFADKTGRITGSLGKSFPTTAAIVAGSMGKSGVKANCYWAGDSRCYLLDANGLHQLTADDLDGEDAMSNLINDGVMTNVISASNPFDLHIKSFEVSYPCILFGATDGCFGYLRSPMEFEYILVQSLVMAKSPAEWRMAMYDKIQSVAGDDFTLCMAAFGYKDFNDMKKSFAKRYTYLDQYYINSPRDVMELWEEYKVNYSMI